MGRAEGAEGWATSAAVCPAAVSGEARVCMCAVSTVLLFTTDCRVRRQRSEMSHLSCGEIRSINFTLQFYLVFNVTSTGPKAVVSLEFF